MISFRNFVFAVFILIAFFSMSFKIVNLGNSFRIIGAQAYAADDAKDGHGNADGEAHMEDAPVAEVVEGELGKGNDMPTDIDIPDWRDSTDDDTGAANIQMEILNDLSARRKELDKREEELRMREALLAATAKEIDEKYSELVQLRTEIEGLMTEQSEEEKARVASLVKIYEGMKPKEAARIFDTLDIDVLVSVVSSMSERRLAPILAKMNPERARTITIMMAEQNTLPTLPGN